MGVTSCNPHTTPSGGNFNSCRGGNKGTGRLNNSHGVSFRDAVMGPLKIRMFLNNEDLTLGPQNVTVFGKRVFKEVIKLNEVVRMGFNLI